MMNLELTSTSEAVELINSSIRSLTILNMMF